MDNRKPKTERTKTPLHLPNTSVLHSKSSAKKGVSPDLSRRPNFNETTASCRGGPSSEPKLKIKPSTSLAIYYETECDLAYNEYLQALMKRQFINKKIAECKQTLDEQLLVQNENLHKINLNYEERVRDTEMLEKQSEIIEIINFLEENLNTLKHIYTKYDMKQQLNEFEEILKLKCDKVSLKHINPIRSQEEYNKFMDVLRECRMTMKKIIDSGRNFEGVNTLAEKIRNFIKIREATQKSQEAVSKLEKDAAYTFLRNMSDFFAKAYNNEPSTP